MSARVKGNDGPPPGETARTSEQLNPIVRRERSTMFERDDADGADVAGRDDIVAYRGDNKRLLIQSKFSGNPNRADLSLSLKWLLWSALSKVVQVES